MIEMTSSIILGMPLELISDRLYGLIDKGSDGIAIDAMKKMKFIEEHMFRCEEHWDGITIVRKVFGVVVDSWVEFNGALDIKSDTLAYIERLFREAVRYNLGLEFNDKLYVIGMTYEESNGNKDH